jgi:hypothetical protein
MPASPILAPVIAFVLWTFVMWVWLYATRIPAMLKNNVVYDPQRPARIPCAASGRGALEGRQLQSPPGTTDDLLRRGADAGVPRRWRRLNAGLAWGYVALRIAHSPVQSLVNLVVVRLRCSWRRRSSCW